MQIVLFVVLLFAACLANGEMRFVSPGMSIQEAVNASVDGDTVLIQDGVYTETVVLYGKTLTIASAYLLDGDTSHVLMTAILPDSLRPDTASCLVYVCGETPASRLVGLTLENGRGTLDVISGNVPVGGGVYLKGVTSDVGLRIERCEFRTCHASLGGGLYAWGWDHPAQIALSDCHFYGCSVVGSGGGLTAGACSLAVQNCMFEACSSATPMSGEGGAMWVMGSELHVDSSRFLACVMGWTAAVSVSVYSTGSITRCLFEGNVNTGPVGAGDLEVTISALTITGCHFNHNVCGVPAVVLDGAQPHSFVGNVIENGVADRLTGSLLLTARWGDVAYNLIRNNANIAGGAVYTVQAGSLPIHTRVHHNVITGNVSLNPGLPSVLITAGMMTALDSNWIAGNSGPTMDYNPDAGTATIDARHNWWGDPSGPYHPTLNPGGQGDTLLSDSVLFIPWLTEPPDTTMPPGYLSVRERPEISRTWELGAVYPNPFNQAVTLVLAGFSGADFEIGLYNLLGQQVDVVHRGPMTGGQLHYQAPPWLASGVYLLSARDKHSIQTKKVVLMK